jgi:hypothetical protein
MRNYRRLSGDGSVKVVLSGDSNSPRKTTPGREPPPHNSSPTQELCTCGAGVLACQLRYRLSHPCRHPGVRTELLCEKLQHAQPGTYHMISSKTPAISPFSPNPTSTSHQRVDCLPWDFVLGNSRVISAWSLVLPPSGRPNPSKKPVSSRKFTFQHQPQTPLASDSVAKFDQSQNVESFPWLPSVQVLSRSRTCRPNSSKKPMFAHHFSQSERQYWATL